MPVTITARILDVVLHRRLGIESYTQAKSDSSLHLQNNRYSSLQLLLSPTVWQPCAIFIPDHLGNEIAEAEAD